MEFSCERLLWPEGTLLAQQHFQQWDRLQQSRDQFWYHFHKRRPREGFLSLSIDVQLLELGILRLNYFHAISREGQVIGFRVNPNNAKSPELDLNTVKFLNVPKQGEVLTAYIAIPSGSSSYGVSGYPKRDIFQTRWIAEYSSCVDEMDAERRQEILFGHLNIQLLVNGSIEFDKRKSENDLLAVAKVICLGAGRYMLKPEFVPPILQLGASNWLMNELRNMRLYLQGIEKSLILKIKNIRKISDHLNSNKSNQSNEWSARELLKVVSLLIYHIRVWLDNPRTDPDEIFDKIMQSIIIIRSFSTYADTEEIIPLSNAEPIYEKFSTVYGLLKDIVQSVLPMRQKNICLVEGPEAWLSSELLGEDVLERAELYLSMAFDEKNNWVDRFMKEVKLSGAKDIQRIITQALSGISMMHCSENMDCILDDKNRSYFKIDKCSPYWEDVRRSDKLCLFMSKQFLNFDIKLVAVFENEDNSSR